MEDVSQCAGKGAARATTWPPRGERQLIGEREGAMRAHRLRLAEASAP
jgi:hypothetical protein